MDDSNYSLRRKWGRNEAGAIDLASIMVGVITLGLIGGVVATTVFAVIPWVQDRAAKQQVDSIVAAQSAYRGLASGVPPVVPEGHTPNSYADSKKLAQAGLLQEGATYCTTGTNDGNGYLAVALSATGKYFAATDGRTEPQEISPLDIPDNCGFPNVDKTPTLTKLTYNCPTTKSVRVPIAYAKGTAKWSDGTTSTHQGQYLREIPSKTLQAGVTYEFTFDGTYPAFGDSWTGSGHDCLISVDHWGSETGVTDASYAFYTAYNLVDVPAQIPSTITNMSYMFASAKNFNDPDVSQWNVSNITNMAYAFSGATNFNQPVNNWNVSNVTDMTSMFGATFGESLFNQPLDKWNVSKVMKMGDMFFGAKSFNQPLNNWNVSKVEDMNDMFRNTAFNQSLNDWDVSNVENMSGMFASSKFDKPLESWNVSDAKSMSYMFSFNKDFNQPLNGWGKKVSNVTDMSGMFSSATKFDQPLNQWDVSNVTNMSEMFLGTPFNRSLNEWDVSNVTNMSGMFNTAQRFNQPLNNWNVSKVQNMSKMFATARAFQQNIESWNVSNVTNMSYMFSGNDGFNQSLAGWNVSKAQNMDGMFEYAWSFSQNISNWDTVSLKSGKQFVPASFPNNYMPARTSK